MKLDLRAPLFYAKTNLTKSDQAEKPLKNEEFLFCYALNPLQSSSIEPERAEFLGPLLFFGKKTEEQPSEGDPKTVSLPQGLYLFTQKRGEADWLDMAIEQQKDGLWERDKLEDTLYIRLLHEDDAPVTQVFRAAEKR
ncbi:MAG: hypothetical protein FWD26_11080 [Treponema sp.]|nr:hypothetical protein [Treponema sp.]